VTRRRDTALRVVVAAAVLVSGYVHFYLYFRGGYRGIAPEEFAGITISRAFALNAVAGVLIAELVAASIVWPRLTAAGAMVAGGFALSTLAAYALTRTTGLLGFTDDQTSTEAVIAIAAEVVAAVGALALLIRSWRQPSPRTADLAAPTT
jgi:hypothetical protein